MAGRLTQMLRTGCLGLLLAFAGAGADGVVAAEEPLGDELQAMLQHEPRTARIVALVKALPPDQREEAKMAFLKMLGGCLSDWRAQPNGAWGLYLEHAVAGFAILADKESLEAMVSRLAATGNASSLARVMCGLMDSGTPEARALMTQWLRHQLKTLPAKLFVRAQGAGPPATCEALRPFSAVLYRLSFEKAPEDQKLRQELLEGLIAKYQSEPEAQELLPLLKAELAKLHPAANGADKVSAPESAPSSSTGTPLFALEPLMVLPRKDSELQQMDLADLEAVLLIEGPLMQSFGNFALDEMTRRKSPEALAFIMEWGAEGLDRLPNDLLPLDEIQKKFEENQGNPPQGSWLWGLNHLAEAMTALSMSALPEGPKASKMLLDQFRQRYGASESGRAIIPLLEEVINQAKARVEAGDAPWEEGGARSLGQ